MATEQWKKIKDKTLSYIENSGTIHMIEVDNDTTGGLALWYHKTGLEDWTRLSYDDLRNNAHEMPGLEQLTYNLLKSIGWDLDRWTPCVVPAHEDSGAQQLAASDAFLLESASGDSDVDHRVPAGKAHWRYEGTKGSRKGQNKKSTYRLYDESGDRVYKVKYNHQNGNYTAKNYTLQSGIFGKFDSLKQLNESLKGLGQPKLHPTAIRVRNALLKGMNRAVGLLTSMIFTTLYYPLLATVDWVRKGMDRMAGRVPNGYNRGNDFARFSPAQRVLGLFQVLTAPLAYVFSLLVTVLWRAPIRGIFGGLRATRLSKLHYSDNKDHNEKAYGDNVVFSAKHVLIALVVVCAWSALIMGLAFGPLATVPVFSAINHFATAAMSLIGIDFVGVGAAVVAQATMVAAVLTTAATAVAAFAILAFQQLGNLIGLAAEKGAERSEAHIGTPYSINSAMEQLMDASRPANLFGKGVDKAHDAFEAGFDRVTSCCPSKKGGHSKGQSDDASYGGGLRDPLF